MADASEPKADMAAAITDQSIYRAFWAVASAALSDAAAAFSSALAARALALALRESARDPDGPGSERRGKYNAIRKWLSTDPQNRRRAGRLASRLQPGHRPDEAVHPRVERRAVFGRQHPGRAQAPGRTARPLESPARLGSPSATRTAAGGRGDLPPRPRVAIAGRACRLLPSLLTDLGLLQPLSQEVDERADFRGRAGTSRKDGMNIDRVHRVIAQKRYELLGFKFRAAHRRRRDGDPKAHHDAGEDARA
jgi:hypothetical protein